MRQRLAAAVILIGVSIGCAGLANADPTPGSAPVFTRSKTDPASLVIAPGREFAADSYVHQPLPPDALLDEHSAEYVADFQRQWETFYGTVNVNIHEYTPPLFIVGPDQPTVRVKVVDWDKPGWTFAPLQEQWLAVPLPDDFKPSPGTDQEAIVYQPATKHYWEFWLTRKTGAKTHNSAGREVDEWGARWGGCIEDLSKNPGYFPPTKDGCKFGTTATSLPFLAGLITIDDQLRGEINHSVEIVIPETLMWDYWSYPARRSDGYTALEKNHYVIPEGATFRLPADLDLDKLVPDPYARMIAKAVQKFGMVVCDKGGAVVFRCENPAGRYAVDPYGWILRNPADPAKTIPAYERLRQVPWDKLQLLKLQMNKPIPPPAPAAPKAGNGG